MKAFYALCGAVLLTASVFQIGCSGSASTSVVGTGQLEILLTDAPLDLTTVASVIVDITAVLVYPGVEAMDGSDTPPIVVMDHPATFDLLTLTDGATALLAKADLPAGFYQRIRMEVTSATMTFLDGRVVDLKIQPHKVDVPITFEVIVDDVTIVTLDFQADASVQVNDPSTDKYILRSVVTPLNN